MGGQREPDEKHKAVVGRDLDGVADLLELLAVHRKKNVGKL